MNDFIATNTPAGPVTGTVANNGFFPDIDLADFAANQRLDQTIPTDRQQAAIEAGILKTNHNLADWQATQQAAGITCLADVTSTRYGDQTAHEQLYRQAVYHWAKGLLVEAYRDYDTTRTGHERADQMTPRINDHRRQYNEAVRRFLGRTRSRIRLL